jgi:TolB-like protein
MIAEFGAELLEFSVYKENKKKRKIRKMKNHYIICGYGRMEFEETQVQKHTDNEVPSIAIIPFDNKGADEDIFYAYGISSDLISDVASAGLIRVASLKEIEELDDLPFKEKARKLSVRYVSNGTLWKMGEIFQLSIELYDIKDSKVVWSDRWQENWDNLPLIKSNLSDGFSKALVLYLVPLITHQISCF